MAMCDPLQPVVLLTDVMDSENEMVASPEERDSTLLFQVEQTEPLDLCLNGTILNNITIKNKEENENENENYEEFSDDDVIFVKEYKVRELSKRCNSQKSCSKGEPRRNPIRKARDTKRFKEYTDVELFDEDFMAESDDEESFGDLSEKFAAKTEDAEDWKIENVVKRSRQKRRIFKKFSHKLGRKRKNSRINEEEKKVKLIELESLIESNLVLIRDYISDVKTVRELNTKGQEKSSFTSLENVISEAVNSFKQQVVLLSIVKELDENDLPKCITKLITSQT